MLNIKWKKVHPEADYSSRVGTDDQGNKYSQPANQETCSVKTPDGKSGYDWTCEGALRRAKHS